MHRYLEAQAREDLKQKMVFIGGPRQVGKTTLAKQLLDDTRGYLNWDIAEHREKILRREIPTAKLVAFDEIHKYRSWRNYLKGLYDLRKGKQQFLVTGSARLDYYRFGGDSLQGRYHYLRLHPFSVAELKIGAKKDFFDLLLLGGFPEPFLRGSKTEARRWSREYRNRFIREEIVSMERISDLGNLELLILRLPELVGAPLSINAIREDLRLDHGTVSRWIEILERMYGIFLVPPFGPPKMRAVKKERKHYHFDWSLVPDESKRFENLVASHLLKWVHYQNDAFGRPLELRYFRDVEGREVDFIITEGKKALTAIECKWSDAEVSRSLRYFKRHFSDVEAWQIAATGTKNYVTPDGIRVSPAIPFLQKFI